ncbi:KGG domain-containing protein [Bacteroides caecimuris]|uniref:KGG domain-containing protein n=1 Tax=Bacteroides caecimuris TaxID=1796613 RepID=UPI0025704B7C|nr:KGG domain-containing protein [Bacteroides caecimuris]
MANERNLRRLSTDEARKIGKKGGKASGETRRKKKSMKQAMDYLLSLPVIDENMETLEQLGIDADDADNQMLVVAKAFQKAIKGNVDAMKFIASITGSVPMNEAEKKKDKLGKERLKLQKQEFEHKKKMDENNQW